MGDEIKIDAKLLRESVRYDHLTGKMFWLARTSETFEDGIQSAEFRCRRWNAQHAGRQAFSVINSKGYCIGRFLGKNYYAHRIAWMIVHGEWPHDQIDHINGDKKDNRMCNLRCVSGAENQKNRPLNRNNSSGQSGVVWVKAKGHWRSQIKVGGEQITLGMHHNKIDAVNSRLNAEKKFGFHENHGRRNRYD